jgi:hypothetical protein
MFIFCRGLFFSKEDEKRRLRHEEEKPGVPWGLAASLGALGVWLAAFALMD